MRVGMGAWVLGIAVGLIGGGAGAQQTPRAPLSAPLIAADPARGHVENALQTLSIPERIAWVKKRNAEETREKVALANAPRVTVA
ncbi:MAG: hypothetical protein ACI4SV_04455, partial [Duodenibacillus sp.]